MTDNVTPIRPGIETDGEIEVVSEPESLITIGVSVEANGDIRLSGPTTDRVVIMEVLNAAVMQIAASMAADQVTELLKED